VEFSLHSCIPAWTQGWLYICLWTYLTTLTLDTKSNFEVELWSYFIVLGWWLLIMLFECFNLDLQFLNQTLQNDTILIYSRCYFCHLNCVSIFSCCIHVIFSLLQPV
jgi:hypothetical protein